jgi:hypothetical protein
LAHDFAQRRVFEVGEVGTVLRRGQEEVPQPARRGSANARAEERSEEVLGAAPENPSLAWCEQAIRAALAGGAAGMATSDGASSPLMTYRALGCGPRLR